MERGKGRTEDNSTVPEYEDSEGYKKSNVGPEAGENQKGLKSSSNGDADGT